MTLSSFILFLSILYFAYIVGRTSWENYQSNKSIAAEEVQVADSEKNLQFMQYQINYYGTQSFKEKEAREKLGYKAPGENVLSLPYDKTEVEASTAPTGEVAIKTPNYRLWWNYFFDDSAQK